MKRQASGSQSSSKRPKTDSSYSQNKGLTDGSTPQSTESVPGLGVSQVWNDWRELMNSFSNTGHEFSQGVQDFKIAPQSLESTTSGLTNGSIPYQAMEQQVLYREGSQLSATWNQPHSSVYTTFASINLPQVVFQQNRKTYEFILRTPTSLVDSSLMKSSLPWMTPTGRSYPEDLTNHLE
jgi:hypothetical protein